MKRLLILVLVLFITGCDDSDSKHRNIPLVSSDEIKHLQIIRDDGNVPPGTDRYNEYNYDNSELSSEALDAIDSISVTTDNLYCANDGTTYKLNITTYSDVIIAYVSNNSDCGRENQTSFILVEDIEFLLSKFE